MCDFVFTGGGTGGHIFPGLAVAENFEKSSIAWIGSSKGIDRRLVESAEIKFYGIPAGKLRRYFSLRNVVDFFKVFGGFFKSLYLLMKLKPRLVFSKGGFVSVPPCAAAKVLGIPVITHECDFSPGLATRINAKFASRIFVSYPQTIELLGDAAKSKTLYTGNPVRSRFYTANESAGRNFIYSGTNELEKPILLILGGSLGAKQLNDIVRKNIVFLCSHFCVAHQVGSKNTEQMEAIKAELEEKDESLLPYYKPFEFIMNEMPDVLASAYLVISRAGANTIWESAAAGKPMILVPLSTGSSRGDQLENAAFFESKGACVVMTGEIGNRSFQENVLRFINDKQFLNSTKEASKKLAGSKPAVEIAQLLKSYAENTGGNKK